jgi:hypothetical protein
MAWLGGKIKLAIYSSYSYLYIILIYILLEFIVTVGHGRPVGTRNPHGHGFGSNVAPVMGYEFLMSLYDLHSMSLG